VHSRWQLIGPEFNRALGQIIQKQAGLQGGQHDQYRPNRKDCGKITMLKESLREIQHPGSGSLRFRGFHLFSRQSLLTFMDRQGKPANLTLLIACDSPNESADELCCFSLVR